MLNNLKTHAGVIARFALVYVGRAALSTARRRVVNVIKRSQPRGDTRPCLNRSTVCFALWVAMIAASVNGAESFVSDAGERAKIEQALPARAPAQPQKPRRLLIFTLNVGYGGHPSMAHASEAFTLMGRKTGAFETTVTQDPAIFAPERLKQFDAVFFNNTVGNCFTNREWRRALAEFVLGGGGLMGVHGTSVAFTRWPGAIEDWPEFGFMIGARGAAHKESDERVWIKVEQADHPLTRMFDRSGFEYRDEFFRFHEPYSRDRVRVLLSIDPGKTDLASGEPRGNTTRADGDYALAWVRNYGQGRVFYSTIAHNPRVFWDPKMLEFYLGAIQFVLGDLPAPTTPSARLSKAVLAQEKLGWRLGIEAYTFHKFTLFETIDRTAQLGLPYAGGLSFQKVSGEIAKNLDPQLDDAAIEAVRLKLAEKGVRLLTYYIQDIPGNEAACRQIFEFGRKLGIETFMTEPKVDALPLLDRFCNEFGINVALHNHDRKASPDYWSPEAVLKACEGRSKRIGACADVGYWMRGGIDPVEGIRKLGSRLMTLQMHDLHDTGAEGHDVPWGTGAGRSAELFSEMRRLGIRPTMIGLEYSYDWFESMPKVEQCIQFFNSVTEAW